MNCTCCRECFKEVKRFVIDKVIRSLERDSALLNKNFQERVSVLLLEQKKNLKTIEPCDLEKVKLDLVDADFVLCIKRAIKEAKEAL